MELKVFSRQTIEQVDFDTLTCVISISTPGAPAADINMENVQDILRLWFDDMSCENDELVARGWPESEAQFTIFTEEQADLILDKFDQWTAEIQPSQVAIHCDAGISRSAGVAAALSIILTGNQGEFIPGRISDDRFHPNTLVKSKILRQWRER